MQEEKHAKLLYQLLRATIIFVHYLYLTNLDKLLSGNKIVVNAYHCFNKYPANNKLNRKDYQVKQIKAMTSYLKIIACGHRIGHL